MRPRALSRTTSMLSHPSPHPAPQSPAAGAVSLTDRPSGTRRSLLLKACLFATGLSGIVAEFVLSTLATYLLGNAILQWTLVMSLMLFAMGAGTRVSRALHRHLLDCFIAVEFLLSLLCAVSSVSIYTLAAFTESLNLFIYALAIAIGLLIGMEIPLVARINETYETLRTNIAGVLEQDYYGALAGGLLFAFVALPRLGLTYTPLALGALNFSVAATLFLRCRGSLRRPRLLGAGLIACTAILAGLALTVEPIILYGQQSRYRDKIIHAEQTPYQNIVLTQFRDTYWLFLDGSLQFSSFDEARYHEPLVHPAMQLSRDRRRVLILGGGDGLAAREALKYAEVEELVLVDLDPGVTKLGRTHPALRRLNANAFDSPRLRVINMDGALYVRDEPGLFDVVIIDLPDPKSVALARLFSLEFYQLLRRRLAPGGVLVTQSTSPAMAPSVFQSIGKTLRAAGFSVLPYHTSVPSMGDWGWHLATAPDAASEALLRRRFAALTYAGITTRYLTAELSAAMLAFGKEPPGSADEVEINTELRPVLPTYYRAGRWGLL